MVKDVECCSLTDERLDGDQDPRHLNPDIIPPGLSGDIYYYHENRGYHGTPIPPGHELGFFVWTTERVYFPVWKDIYLPEIVAVSVPRCPSKEHIYPLGPREE